MLKARRGIHKAQNDNEDDGNHEQVEEKCCKCNKRFDQNSLTQIDIVDKQYEQLGIKLQLRYKEKADESERIFFLCQNCNKTLDGMNDGEHLYGLKKLLPMLSLVFIVIILVCCYYQVFKKEKTFEVNIFNQTQEESDFDNELYKLEDIYKQQDEKVWYTFAAGIKSVLAEKPYKPSVFLMLYDNDKAEKTVRCLVQDVATVASKYLMKKEVNPIIFTGAGLNIKETVDDSGTLLVALKHPIEEHGAMVVTNIQDVKPEVATSFHFFCDRYSPLVEKAVFFFTLKVDSIPNIPLQRVVEDALGRLWKDLPEYKLSPLITRLSGNVLKISEDHSDCKMWPNQTW